MHITEISLLSLTQPARFWRDGGSGNSVSLVVGRQQTKRHSIATVMPNIPVFLMRFMKNAG